MLLCSFQLGIVTPPFQSPVTILDWGIRQKAPFQSAEGWAIGIGTNPFFRLPSAICHLPFLVHTLIPR